jgi:diguanylate cyclase (GGDEF)-like protein
VLPETDLQGARAVAERMRARMAELALPHESSTVAPVVTLSMGVATVRPAEGEDPVSIIRIADGALYEAKRKGRDRIEAV